ncbi:MAG: hypothetical protein K9H84_00895 [Bacteroidales bacterium]|nr:hypothetical protein [Bacteroidales bacterium]
MSSKITAFIVFFFLLNMGYSQNQRKERYNGTMQNGLMQPGEVTYYYYKDGRDRIMDGVFRYRLRWRNEERQRVYQTINGSMENDKKAGTWSYTIKVQDYFEDKEGYFYSYDVQLNASYEKGIPHGSWSLNKSVKKRQQDKDSRKGWGSYKDKNIYVIKLVFDHGQLVDSVYFSDEANNTLIKGQIDTNGFYHGKWIIQKDGIRKIENYHHGIITKRIQKTLNGKVQDQQSLMVNKDMWIRYTSEGIDKSKLTFKPETLKVLKNADHIIPQMINDHIFDYRLFLYSYIPGDELINDFPGKNPASLFAGLKKVNFEYQINREQAKLLAGISREAKKTQINFNKAKRYVINNGLESQVKSTLDRMERISKLTAKYDCLSGTIKSFMNVNEGTNAAYQACNLRHPISVKLPANQSKEQLIKHIYKKVHNMHFESRDMLKKIKEIN